LTIRYAGCWPFHPRLPAFHARRPRHHCLAPMTHGVEPGGPLLERLGISRYRRDDNPPPLRSWRCSWTSRRGFVIVARCSPMPLIPPSYAASSS
jgi:hypothetical protein